MSNPINFGETAPVDGDIFTVSPERKLVFRNGVWKLFSNNIPVSGPINEELDLAPIVSDTMPATNTAAKHWYNTVNKKMYFQKEVGGVKSWERTEDLVEVDMAATGIIDLDKGDIFNKTVTGNITLILVNVPSGVVAFMLRVRNGGSANVVWPSNIAWEGGQPPVLSAAGLDVFSFVKTAAGFDGFQLSKDSKAVS